MAFKILTHPLQNYQIDTSSDRTSVHCKKRAYMDKDAALTAIHGIANKKDGRKKPVRAYECEECGHWHLTSKRVEEMISVTFKLTQDWSGVMTPMTGKV